VHAEVSATTRTPAVGEIPGQPLVGHLLAFRRDRLALLDACLAEPGDVIRLRIRTPAYLLKRAEDVGHVLIDREDVYSKDPRNVGPRATRIFGDGVMTSAGARHRRMRRQVQPFFRLDSMAPLADIAVQSADAMVDGWEPGAVIELAEEMERFALRNMVSAVFGPDSPVHRAALETGISARRLSMTRGLSAPVPLPAFLPLALRLRRRRAIKQLERTVEGLIQAKREQRVAGGDLLSMIRDGDHSMTFALAAFENVGRALTWTQLALARHPYVGARLQAELEHVLGNRPPHAGDFERLRYTQMVLAESMRLWPPNALLSRVARREDRLPTGTRIAAGSKLLLSPYVLHRNPIYWREPERFDPERFGAEESRGRPRHAYIPFGAGPRVCIGRSLATLTCTLALARFVQRARLELCAQAPGYVCGCLPAGFGPAMRVGGRDGSGSTAP